MARADGWRAKYGGLEVSEARRLHELEDENRKLKRLVANQALDIQALTGVTVATDTTAPAISAVAAGSLTGDSAVITWTTDEASTSQVEFGLTTAYGSTTTLDGNLVTSHSVPVTGLTAGTTYHFRVLSRDGTGKHTIALIDQPEPLLTTPTGVNLGMLEVGVCGTDMVASSGTATTRIGGIWCCSTNIFTVRRVAAWEHPIRPDGPRWSPAVSNP